MTGETTLTIVGNLTADPELRYTQSGLAVVNFTIASTPRERDRQTGETKDGEPIFARCSAWREHAEHIAASLSKGSRVIALVRYRQRRYQTEAGENRTSHEFEVEDIGPALRWATASVTKASPTGQTAFREPVYNGGAPEPDSWHVPAEPTATWDETPF